MHRTGLLGALALVLLMAASPVLAQPKDGASQSVEAQILDILIEKDIVTPEQYRELKAQLRSGEDEKNISAVEAGFDKGFYLRSTDGKHSIKLKGRFHGDFKGYPGNHPDNDSFFVRRARLALQGTFYKHFEFKLESEFGKGNAQLNDGYANIAYFPRAQLKIGQFKTPFSMEELHSDNWIDFVERSLANNLVPSRDIGVMLHGGLWDGFLYYQLGLFNGFRKNQASDADDGKDLAARVVAAPFKKLGHWTVQELRLGAAVTHGQEDLEAGQWWNSGEFSTAAGTDFLEMDPGVVQDGARTRTGLELYWAWGPTAVKSEYVNARLEGVQLGDQEEDLDFDAGYAEITHNLTGEDFVYKNGKPARIIPESNFNPRSGAWGALQLSLRYEFLRAEDDVLGQGFADPARFTDEAAGYTAGINWYLTPMVRFMLNYSHNDFEDPILVDGERLDDEDVILSRFQIAL